MSFRSFIYRPIIVALVIAFNPVLSLAVPLQIFDCNGVSRASKDVTPSSNSEVKIEVSSNSGTVADGTEITLTNSDTGEVLTAKAANGTVTFPQVASGSWVIGSTVPNILFSSVLLSGEVSALLAAGAAVGAGVVGGGAIAGAAIVVDEEINNDNKDNESNLTPTPAPQPTPQPTPTVDPLCPDCDSDEDADELEDFFNAKKEEEQQALKNQKEANKNAATNCLNDKELPPLSQSN